MHSAIPHRIQLWPCHFLHGWSGSLCGKTPQRETTPLSGKSRRQQDYFLPTLPCYSSTNITISSSEGPGPKAPSQPSLDLQICLLQKHSIDPRQICPTHNPGEGVFPAEAVRFHEPLLERVRSLSHNSPREGTKSSSWGTSRASLNPLATLVICSLCCSSKRILLPSQAARSHP